MTNKAMHIKEATKDGWDKIPLGIPVYWPDDYLTRKVYGVGSIAIGSGMPLDCFRCSDWTGSRMCSTHSRVYVWESNGNQKEPDYNPPEGPQA